MDGQENTQRANKEEQQRVDAVLKAMLSTPTPKKNKSKKKSKKK